MTGGGPDVLVVGGGPVGLSLALAVAAHGGTVRVVERRTDRRRPSRAMVVHARTLEGLRPLGVVDALLARADTSPTADLHIGRRVVRAQLSEVDLPSTAFPHLTMIRQQDLEDVLHDELRRRDVFVEHGCELVDLPDVVGARSAHATLRSANGLEQVRARFVVGSDGTASTTRTLLGIRWRGGRYNVDIVLADLELAGPLTPGRLHVSVGTQGLAFVFPLGEGATWRLLATRPRLRGTGDQVSGGGVPVGEVQRLLDESGLDAVVTAMPWAERIPVQHRLAAHYRSGRVFLAGDAAHTHSPAAAQGMNTGIQDAVNLGWKLAFAARGRAPEGDLDSVLLDSYELERRPVARQVRALTDAVFAAEASTRLLPRLLRARVLPVVATTLPLAVRQRRLMALVLRVLSQCWVDYRHSPLSVNAGPADGWRTRPGDQLRDAAVVVEGPATRLHELTSAPGVHLLISRDAPDLSALTGPLVTGHRLTDHPGSGVLAVRPDGHVGFRGEASEPDALADWLRVVGAVRTRSA